MILEDNVVISMVCSSVKAPGYTTVRPAKSVMAGYLRGLGGRQRQPASKDGSYSLYCAVIVKKVDAKTLSKVGINELLRGI